MPTIAIQVGMMAGSMALQYLLRPKVKQQPVDKGKFDDIRITGSDYGAFVPRVWGKARIGGNILVSTGIDHYIIDTPSSGGKGGVPQAPAQRTHVYKTSVWVLFCRRITSFQRIWGDTDIIGGVGGGGINTQTYLEAEDATLSGASVFIDVTASGGHAVTGISFASTVFFPDLQAGVELLVPIEPGEPASRTRISLFYKSSGNVTVQIKTNSELGLTTQNVVLFDTGDQWSVQTVHMGGLASDLEYSCPSGTAPDLDKIGVYFYYANSSRPDNAYRVSGAVHPGITYPPDVNDPSEYYNYPVEKDAGTGESTMTTPIPGEEIRYYTGTPEQTQDSRIASWLDSRWGTGIGITRTSAYRGFSGIMFQDRTLRSGHLENFTAEVYYEENTVNAILEELCGDVGITPEECDFSATDGLEQIGFLEHSGGSRKALIEHLERFHQFRLAEIDGKLKTVLDNGPTVGSISHDELRAHAYGEEMPAFDAEVELKEESAMPREVKVSGMVPELEYHNESVSAQLFAGVVSTESREFTFPIVEAKEIFRQKAEILLRKEHAESRAFEFWGMPSTARYAIGDVITETLNGVEYEIRIEKKKSTLPIGKVVFQGVLRDPIAFITGGEVKPVANLAPALREDMLGTTPFPRNTVIFVIHSVPIVEKDVGRLGVYLAICGRGRGYAENSALYREIGDENYVQQQIVDSSTPLGLCDGILGDDPEKGEDDENTLDIWFFDAVELETVTSDDLDRYPTVNLMRVGDEWLQFMAADPQTLEANSPYKSKWRISILRRALFGTVGEGHSADEYAALVTPAMRFFELNQDDIGETINLKAVTGGQALEVAPVASFVFAPPSNYNITNVTERRSLDADSTTLNQLCDVVGTLIDDLNV